MWVYVTTRPIRLYIVCRGKRSCLLTTLCRIIARWTVGCSLELVFNCSEWRNKRRLNEPIFSDCVERLEIKCDGDGAAKTARRRDWSVDDYEAVRRRNSTSSVSTNFDKFTSNFVYRCSIFIQWPIVRNCRSNFLSFLRGLYRMDFFFLFALCVLLFRLPSS